MNLIPRITIRFTSPVSGILVLGFALTLTLSVCTRTLVGQDFGVQSSSAPSVIGAGTFVSLEGRFAIALPKQKHSFSALSLETPAGQATGDSYGWSMKEGSFLVGFVDAPQSPNGPDAGKGLLENMHESTVTYANSKSGKISERSIALDKHPGKEIRVEFTTGVMIQRLFLVSHRLYQIILVVKADQHVFEGVALNVLDSFRLLNEAEVATELKAEAVKAEPSPLPQEPVAPRAGTDAGDEGLHGKVKTVLTESQDLSGTGSVQSRKKDSMEYYNERGNLIKSESYDWKGNLSDIDGYGYLDGARVSNWKGITHEYNPPPVMVTPTPGEAKSVYDQRYSYRFDFKYDNSKRLVEKTWINNAGKLWLRYVYKYSGKQKESLVYSADGSLNQRYVALLDDNGNEIEETIYEAGGQTVSSKKSYAYEFDAQGNWTKRTTSNWVTKDGRSSYQPESVDFRTISYY